MAIGQIHIRNIYIYILFLSLNLNSIMIPKHPCESNIMFSRSLSLLLISIGSISAWIPSFSYPVTLFFTEGLMTPGMIISAGFNTFCGPVLPVDLHLTVSFKSLIDIYNFLRSRIEFTFFLPLLQQPH